MTRVRPGRSGVLLGQSSFDEEGMLPYMSVFQGYPKKEGTFGDGLELLTQERPGNGKLGQQTRPALREAEQPWTARQMIQGCEPLRRPRRLYHSRPHKARTIHKHPTKPETWGSRRSARRAGLHAKRCVQPRAAAGRPRTHKEREPRRCSGAAGGTGAGWEAAHWKAGKPAPERAAQRSGGAATAAASAARSAV